MGIFCSFCNKSSDSAAESDEEVPLINPILAQKDNNNLRQRNDSYYKKIILTTSSRIISSYNHQHRNSEINQDAVNEMKSKLVSYNAVGNGSKIFVSNKINCNVGNNVVDILSKSMMDLDAYDIDRISDEIADIVSSYVHNRIDDTFAIQGGSAVISLKGT